MDAIDSGQRLEVERVSLPAPARDSASVAEVACRENGLRDSGQCELRFELDVPAVSNLGRREGPPSLVDTASVGDLAGLVAWVGSISTCGADEAFSNVVGGSGNGRCARDRGEAGELVAPFCDGRGGADMVSRGAQRVSRHDVHDASVLSDCCSHVM